MRPFKIIIGSLLVLMGMLASCGRLVKAASVGSDTLWHQVQDSLGAGLLILIGAAVLVSAREKRDEE